MAEVAQTVSRGPRWWWDGIVTFDYSRYHENRGDVPLA